MGIEPTTFWTTTRRSTTELQSPCFIDIYYKIIAMEYQRQLIQALFKTPIIIEHIPMSHMDILWPQFDSLVSGIYDTYYDVELYDTFLLDYHDDVYECQLGFTTTHDDDDSLHGVVNFTSDEKFNIKDIDWWID